MKRWLCALSLAMLANTLGACATVRPWQRERLAAPCMQLDGPSAPTAYENQVRAIRSGDVRASANGGGGCGCN